MGGESLCRRSKFEEKDSMREGSAQQVVDCKWGSSFVLGRDAGRGSKCQSVGLGAKCLELIDMIDSTWWHLVSVCSIFF